MYRKLFEKIKTASKKKSLTFFVGAGISALSYAPTWKQLIEAICDEMQIEKKKDYTTDDYLRISQMFFYSIKKDKDKYYDFSVDLYTHGIINDKEIKDIKDKHDYSVKNDGKDKDSLEL